MYKDVFLSELGHPYPRLIFHRSFGRRQQRVDVDLLDLLGEFQVLDGVETRWIDRGDEETVTGEEGIRGQVGIQHWYPPHALLKEEDTVRQPGRPLACSVKRFDLMCSLYSSIVSTPTSIGF